ncbi:Single-stranded DNA-binding protein [Leuconostoc inhae]|mgnify:CR=1 FL=1|uniref:Single-stranded DNA-binding protein n=2 Tax=Leuconostoc TaxID=1243 RepID=A0AAN2QU93_9LACO|nr:MULTISPECIES: single-stranded DNA-binding protein [Leuconostoc]MBM7435743.1 single-strand DNA-binding protein [Leuconostoc rapi]MBZ5958953.1 single-stranded DNA-binding protein [Leuconostoc gasicomitatum]MBZ5980560.1 single-stranded DNA-binding protein [Leuconostoc gasicomitatum]MBZ5982043.1 single-stranded DNA-binding protein [Leuconostoc gasicomitatum]MBZ5987733.1 single-stranded DNA-binding protein [Leuconostoc gasicomitatum]
MQINHHVGRLVRHVTFTVRGENQTKIVYFKLAINDLKDGKATYIDYVAFNKTADLIHDYVTEVGQVVEVQFVMRNHNYTDKTTGEKIYTIQNQVTQFRIYNPASDTKKQDSATLETPQNNNNISDKDLPPYPDFDSDDFNFVAG